MLGGEAARLRHPAVACVNDRGVEQEALALVGIARRGHDLQSLIHQATRLVAGALRDRHIHLRLEGRGDQSGIADLVGDRARLVSQVATGAWPHPRPGHQCHGVGAAARLGER